MYTISKEFAFEASHQLSGMPEGHPCARLHGHSYRVVLVLGGDRLDGRGMVLDYGNLAPFKEYLAGLDHRHLNDVFPQFNPTAENLACALFGAARAMFGEDVREVRVSETAKTWAGYGEGA